MRKIDWMTAKILMYVCASTVEGTDEDTDVEDANQGAAAEAGADAHDQLQGHERRDGEDASGDEQVRDAAIANAPARDSNVRAALGRASGRRGLPQDAMERQSRALIEAGFHRWSESDSESDSEEQEDDALGETTSSD